MNERIQQLAEQVYGSQATEQEIKFAELIVRECAAEADKHTIDCRGIPWGRWINQHCGVE